MSDDPTTAMDTEAVTEKQDVEEDTWLVQKEILEQANFNLTKELDETKEKVAELTKNNGILHSEVTKSATEKLEDAKKLRELESTRNTLVSTNIELETSVSRLRMEKDERDAAIVSLNKEKQQLSVESFALRDQISALANEKASLSLTIESFKQEKRAFAFEKEKIASEREIFAESKKWYMQEISNRDAVISNLKNQMSAKKLEATNEEVQLRREFNDAKLQVEELQALLETSKAKCDELIQKLGTDASNYIEQIESLKVELKCQTEIVDVLKADQATLELAAHELREDVLAKDTVVREVEQFMKDQDSEFNEKIKLLEETVAEKEKTIESLREDVLKANGLLKSKHAVHINITEEELAQMSPAAAKTSRLLKNEKSMTDWVREYAFVSGELAEAKENNQMLLEQLNEFHDIIQERLPDVMNQKNAVNSLFDKNVAFEGQLKGAEDERQKIINERDGVARELAFTRAELEKYQRDYQLVTKQVHQLMFAQERERNVNADEDWNDADDAKLFVTIQQLQQRNIQLENDIEKEKKSAAQAAMSAQNSELVSLKAELSSSKEEESKLKKQIEQLKSALEVVKSTADHFRDLVKDSVTATEARNARLKAEEAMARTRVAEARVGQLEEHLKVLKEERDKKEQLLADKLEMTEMNFRNLQKINVHIEITLEEQKKIAGEMQTMLEVKMAEVETKQEEIQQLLLKEAKNSLKIEDLSQKLLQTQQKETILRRQKEHEAIELRDLQSKWSVLKAENEAQRNAVMKEQQLMVALGELTTRLNRVEAEKQSAAATITDALRVERDSLKTSLSRISDQLTATRNEAKVLQTRLENELTAVRTKLTEKEQQVLASECELIDLRSKLASVQSQYVEDDSVALSPERLKKECQQLKNRIQFLETQLDEAKLKLLEADAEKTKRLNEKDLVERHSNVLEANLKEIEELGSMERGRLQSKADSLQKRCDELTASLEKLRNDHENVLTVHSDFQIETEKESAELRRQVSVAEMQTETANLALQDAQAALQDVQQRLDDNAGQVSQLNLRLSELQGELAISQEKISLMELELGSKSAALTAAQDALTQADQLREAAETNVAIQRAEKQAIENDALEKMKQYEARLDELTTMTLRTAEDAPMDASGAVTEDGLPVVEMQKNLIQYIREEKNKAISRSMNAEVTMRRLQAETAEYENHRNELLTKIRDLETESATQAAALIEQAKLAEKVEALGSVQRDNAMLQEEKLQLTQDLNQTKKVKSALEMKLVKMTSDLNAANLSLTTATSELTVKKKEVEQMKKRLETAGRGFQANMQNEIDNLKSRLEEETKQSKVANMQAVDAEKELNALKEVLAAEKNRSQQTRKLAINYREKNSALTERIAALESGTGAAASIEEIEKLKAQVKTLTDANEALTKAKADLEVNQMRMGMLENRMKKASEQIKALTDKNQELLKANEKIQADLETCETQRKTATLPQSTDSETLQPASSTSSSSTPSKPISQVPRASFAQTATAAAASSAGPKPQAKAQFAKPTTGQPSPSVAENTPTFRQKPTASTKEVVPPVPSEAVPDPKPAQQQAVLSSSSTRLPVPTTFESFARVPAQNLFGTTQPQQAPPSEPTFADTQRSGANVLPNIEVPISSSSRLEDALLLPEESVTEAGQSSLVSGSAESGKNQELDLVGDSESRDSASGAGVSSSEGKRKRAATDTNTSNDVKRVRESSSSEAVTSSQARQPRQAVNDVPELEELENEVSDEDGNQVDDVQMLQDGDAIVLGEEDDDDVVQLDDDGDMDGEEENGSDDDDDSFGGDEEYDEPDDDEVDNIEALENRVNDDDVVVISSDDESDEDSIDDFGGENEASNDLEVHGGEDSQPSIPQDVDREAASAVEEADDEERSSSVQGQPPHAALQHNNDVDASAPQDPTGASSIASSSNMLADDREDQCSSSNETSDLQGASSSNAAALRGRSARRSRAFARGRGAKK